MRELNGLKVMEGYGRKLEIWNGMEEQDETREKCEGKDEDEISQRNLVSATGSSQQRPRSSGCPSKFFFNTPLFLSTALTGAYPIIFEHDFISDHVHARQR